MRPLAVKRFKQDPSECSIAASASLANYFNKEIDYTFAKNAVTKIVKDPKGGLYSGEIALLLNELGFGSVHVITADLSIVDFAWAKWSKAKMIESMNDMLKSRVIDEEVRRNIKAYRRMLNKKDRKNNLVVDYHFGDYIRQTIDSGSPLMISYNWSMLWKYPKQLDSGEIDYLNGDFTYHAVCVRGYNDIGVHIVDSHHEFYKRQLSKYRKGYYIIPWEDLFTTMGSGDAFIATDYNKDLVKNELVQTSTS